MNKNGKQQALWIFLILAAAVFVVGMFVQKQYDIFSILPAGQYRSNTDCTFLTNVAEGSLYKDSNGWISVDGVAYGEQGYSSYACSDSAATTVGHTIEGNVICTRTGYSDRVYVHEGAYGVIFTTSSANTAGAITSCGTSACTENWQCGAWTICANNLQTRTCVDSNLCGTFVNEPAQSQSCTSGGTGTGNCLLTDANNNGKVDRDELGTVINRWVTGA